jgi:hypothetical protein
LADAGRGDAQRCLADGLVEGAGRNRQRDKLAALVDRVAPGRRLAEVYAAPVERSRRRPRPAGRRASAWIPTVTWTIRKKR